MKEIKLFRNIVRCMVLPCIISSTNVRVNNMLNLKSSSSHNLNSWVNSIIRLLRANLMGIMKQVKVNNMKLINFVDSSFNLKTNDNQI